MPVVLNFEKNELAAVQSFLEQFEPLETIAHQRYRTRIGLCMVTLFESGKLLIQGDNASAVSRRILENVPLSDEMVLGIDETGRGESTGPLVVCGVLGNPARLREVRDSKKTRDIAARAKYVRENAARIACIEYEAQTIDLLREKGINLNQIQSKAIDLLCDFFRQTGFAGRIIVDGSPLPVKTEQIEFVPRADDSNPCVAAASVMARFVRDSSQDTAVRKSWKTALPDPVAR